MRFRFLPFLCLLLLSQISLGQQQTIEVPFENQTGAGSPFDVTGKVLVRETIAGNQSESSWEDEVVLKNTSDKPIVLLIAHLNAVGPHSNRANMLTIDRFFKGVLHSGDSFPLPGEMLEGSREVICCINPLDKGRDPKATFRVSFVQFLDGSTFGDPADAQDVFASRTTVVNALRELARTYSEQGEKQFHIQLAASDASSGVFIRIRQTEQAKGTEAAISQVRSMLTLAKEREAIIGMKSAR